MFTGIVKAQGLVTKISPFGNGLSVQMDVMQLDIETISIGDSIAVNGVCLTVTAVDSTLVDFDVSEETINKTLIGQWKESEKVNLETALKLETPLGGHLVSGHVDGFAELKSIEKGYGEFVILAFSVDKILGKYLVVKGSVALDGISLTINEVEDSGDHTLFYLTIVPHTLTHTNLSSLIESENPIGEKMHIEVDQIARYVHRLMTVDR